MHYIFVINGRHDYAHVADELKNQLADLDLQYTLYHTTGVGDATRFTRVYCDLHRAEEVCFVACGGSGTCNEVASGIVGESNKSMAVLSYGFANDLLKSFPPRDFQSIAKIVKGTVQKLDILKVNDNYALNVCNFGFDSIVAREANYLTEGGKKHPYERGIIRALIGGRFNRIQVVADGQPLNKKMILSCLLSNGKYVGKEYCCAPQADLSDGLMDVCLIKTMSLLNFLRIIPYFKRGKHVQPRFARKIVYRKAAHVDVHAHSMIYLALDGELLPGSDFSIDVLPQAVRFVLPAE